RRGLRQPFDGLRTPDRQRDVEDTALALLTLHPDPPTVALSDALDDSQPQPGTLRTVLVLLRHAVKFLEQPDLLFLRNAWTAVLDAEDDVVAILLGAHDHDTTVRGVFDGIADQIGDSATHKATIGP